jgi:hypothetical protein
MPSDFDDFTPAAMWRYTGSSFEVLEPAFAATTQCIAPGFGECALNGGISRSRTWKKFLPEEARQSAQVEGTQWNGKL